MQKILIPFNWIIDHTFGYLYQAFCWLLNLILPDSFTLVITRYQDLFYQGIKYTLGISLMGTIIGFLIACVLGTLRSIKVNGSDHPVKKVVKRVVDFLIRIYVTVP